MKDSVKAYGAGSFISALFLRFRKEIVSQVDGNAASCGIIM